MPVQPEASAQLPSVIKDCWKIIGVLGGDRSCPELVKHTHCRNCPVYAEAGVQLLDRELPPGYRRLWGRRLAQPAVEAGSQRQSAIVFRIGSEWFALPTTVLQEVAEYQAGHSLPHMRPDWPLGLVNIRGELVVRFSMHRLLGLEAQLQTDAAAARRCRLLVTTWNGMRQAFVTDEVSGLEQFSIEVKQPAIDVSSGHGVAFTSGFLNSGGRLVRLLDQDSLFLTVNQNFA